MVGASVSLSGDLSGDGKAREPEIIGARILEPNRRGRTFLIVEHNRGFVMGLCHRVVVPDHGHPIAAGAPTEVRDDPVVPDACLGGRWRPCSCFGASRRATAAATSRAP